MVSEYSPYVHRGSTVGAGLDEEMEGNETGAGVRHGHIDEDCINRGGGDVQAAWLDRCSFLVELVSLGCLPHLGWTPATSTSRGRWPPSTRSAAGWCDD